MQILKKTLFKVASFYDKRKVGENGRFGFRRSSELMLLYNILDVMIKKEIILPKKSVFMDLGCADGRVNVFFSYITKASIGIEIDEWSLEEYEPLLANLITTIKAENLPAPPNNIYLFKGDVLDLSIYGKIKEKTGYGIEDVDLFYTYLFMYEEIAELLRNKAKKGAFFLIYGIGDIVPRLEGFKYIKLCKGIGIYQKVKR